MTLAGIPLLKVVFLQTGQGLESIVFQPPFGPIDQIQRRGQQLEAHLERHLGPPTVRAKLGALWEMPRVLVMRSGDLVIVSDPKSPSARLAIQRLREDASSLH